MRFPIDLTGVGSLSLQPGVAPTDAQLSQLEQDVQRCRDAIVFYTAIGAAKGVGGHSGGPYDIVPEVLIAEAFIRGGAPILPIFFDEAGHRVAIQYLLSVLHGHMPAERLLRYREAGSQLPGHPERHFTPGVEFSSGRLGHMWPYINGVALANPKKCVMLFGSDGSQQEGNDAEAARLAVAQNLNVKLFIDDNDVTIAGHPSDYMPGFSVASTLRGHGLSVDECDGEDLPALVERMGKAVTAEGPFAVVARRPMAPGLGAIEGSPKGHDVVSVAVALEYLRARGHEEAARYLEQVPAMSRPKDYQGVSETWGKNRDVFGKAVCTALERIPMTERGDKVLVVDSDLEGSCGLSHVRKAFPEVYLSAGIMERGNYSAAAGFGMQPGRQGIFATFSAFQEMLISEITMARLNDSNVLAHFSHAGVDDMADNLCHFGINNFFSHNGVEDGDTTRLYFPADQHQMHAVVARVFDDPGLRFVFSTRSPVPDLLDADGNRFFGDDYTFEPGRDELVREGSAGYIVCYGEMVFRCVDAAEQLKAQGIDVGVISKPTLNVVDEDMMQRVGQAPFALVVEAQNRQTGLGIRYGSWLLERGLSPKYRHLGVTKAGLGGLWEQMTHQELDPQHIVAAAKSLVG